MLKRMCVAATLVLLLLQTTAISALAFYWTDCQNSNVADVPTWHVYRNTQQYTQARATTVIRQLHGCTSPIPPETSFSAVFPVNLQDSDGNPFVQVGYGDIEGQGLAFYAVTGDSSGGTVSAMSIGFAPVIGHSVTFEIYPVTLGGPPPQPMWRMKVTDTSTNPDHVGWRDVVRHISSTDKVWFGIETHNVFDQFGGAGSTNIVRIQYMGYQYSADGTTNYTLLTGTTKVAWANTGGHTIPACWVESVSTITGGYTSLNGYTSGCP